MHGSGAATNPGAETIFRLIGEIHDAVEDPRRWRPFTEDLARVLHNRREWSLAPDGCARDADRAEHSNAVVEGFDLLRRLDRRMARHGHGHVTAQFGRARMPAARALRAGFVLTILLPHLRRAILLAERLSTLRVHRTASAKALNVAAAAAILIDERGTVLRVNARAREILRKRDGLTLERRQLRAASKSETLELRALLVRACAKVGGSRPAEYRTKALKRPSGLRPLQLGVTTASLSGPFDVAGRGPAAVLFVHDPETVVPIDSSLAIRFHGLTGAEAAVAAGIAKGWSIHQIATSREVAIGTVRWQIKSVLAKTGTRSQAELVRLLIGGVAIAATSRGRRSKTSTARGSASCR